MDLVSVGSLYGCLWPSFILRLNGRGIPASINDDMMRFTSSLVMNA